MTRKIAKKCAEIMLAYANGAEIESCDFVKNKWFLVPKPRFHWSYLKYRIAKPKKTNK